MLPGYSVCNSCKTLAQYTEEKRFCPCCGTTRLDYVETDFSWGLDTEEYKEYKANYDFYMFVKGKK